MNSAMLDTSFLITLSDPGRTNHETAKRYFIELMNRGVTVFISAIAISEFEVKQRIADLGRHNFIVLPFNVDHAIAAGALTAPMLARRVPEYPRVCVKDDIKLIAQCELSNIEYFFSDDVYCIRGLENLRKDQPTRQLPRGVVISEPFTGAWFDGNQTGIEFEASVD